MGVVRPREPFKFWWAHTISLERLKLQSSISTDVGYVKIQHMDDKSYLKGAWPGSRDPL